MGNLESLSVKPKSKRIFYFDALRALAILSVILFHVYLTTDSFILDNVSYHSLTWFFSDFIGASFRIGVVLFLVLAGSLSLGRDWTIRKFLGRRIPRIVIPFLFWGFVFSTLIAGFYWFYPNATSILAPNILNKLSVLNPCGIVTYLHFLYSYYMADAFTSTSYWFFWMILGTYLIMPIFNKWVYNSDLGELEYFLFFWLITCLFDHTLGIPFPIKLTYFVSPIGLVVLGYYLRYTDRKILNNPYFDILLIIFAWICQLIVSYMVSTPSEFYYLDRYSIFTAIEVIGIVLLFKNFGKLNIHINFFDNPEGIFHKSIFSIAKYSYGMYLVQRFVITFIWEIIRPFSIFKMFPALSIVVLFILSAFFSWAIIHLLNYIPNMGKIVGAK